MRIYNLVQGSPEWHQFRSTRFTASDAPAMLGLSKYKTRNELLQEKATGIAPEHDAATLKRFEKGHKAEAAARDLLEQELDLEFFPVTGTHDVYENVAASLDGITDEILSDEHAIFEHKLWNVDFVDYILENQDLPDTHWPQVEQQLFVSGAEKCYFVMSDGTRNKRHIFEYTARPGRMDKVISGWAQFKKDLESFEVKEANLEVQGKAPESLMPLLINVTGQVTNSNLKEFKANALRVFESINTDLKTDEDFANADKTIKWCEEVERKLKEAKETALSQTASIAEVFKILDDLGEESRQRRLSLSKSVQTRKKEIKATIACDARKDITQYYNVLNHELDGLLPFPQIDLDGAMKRKQNIETLTNAANEEAARVKIDLSITADKIRGNLLLIDSEEEYAALFADKAQLVLKDSEFVALEVKRRVDEHKAAEEAKIEEAKRKLEEAGKLEDQKKVEPEKQAEPEVITESKPAPKVDLGKVALTRPTDNQIIEAIAIKFNVIESKAIEWLLGMDLTAASEKLASNF